MTLIEWIESILGSYNPVTYSVYRVSGDTEVYDQVVAQGLAGVDWRYIITGLLLIITVWSVFRMLGLILEVFRK